MLCNQRYITRGRLITCHFTLAILDVHCERSRQPGTEVTAHPILNIDMQLLLVAVQNKLFRMERQIELIHQHSQAADLFT